MDINPLLMPLLASRLGNGTDPAVMELITRSLSGGKVDANQTEELMNRVAENNPALAPMIERMREQRTRATVIENDRTAADTQDVDLSALNDLRLQAERMYAELSFLRERNQVLANGLGACALCWGEDNACRACHGRGRPGYAIPEPELFTTIVIPAARMWRLFTAGSERERRSAAGQSTTRSQM